MASGAEPDLNLGFLIPSPVLSNGHQHKGEESMEGGQRSSGLTAHQHHWELKKKKSRFLQPPPETCSVRVLVLRLSQAH